MNLYVSEIVARVCLEERHAAAMRHALARAARPEHPLRSALGRALVRLGTRLQGGLEPARASA